MKNFVLALMVLLIAGCTKEPEFEPIVENNVLCEIFVDGDYRVDLVCLGGLAYVREKVGEEEAFVQYLENTPDGLCIVRCGNEAE